MTGIKQVTCVRACNCIHEKSLNCSLKLKRKRPGLDPHSDSHSESQDPNECLSDLVTTYVRVFLVFYGLFDFSGSTPFTTSCEISSRREQLPFVEVNYLLYWLLSRLNWVLIRYSKRNRTYYPRICWKV